MATWEIVLLDTVADGDVATRRGGSVKVSFYLRIFFDVFWKIFKVEK